MTTEIPLLPLPEWMNHYTIPADDFEGVKVVMLADRMRDYARANVEHHTEALRAEADALREVLAELVSWVPSEATYRSLGFDTAALVQTLRRARAALAKEGEQ